MIERTDLEAPYGRPGYNFRILGRSPEGTNNYGNLFYGGGTDINGEFEKYGTDYWIPGFISGPEGVSPEGATPYPEGPVVKWTDQTTASTTTWGHYTWIITENKVQVYHRWTNESVVDNQKILDLYTPTIKDTATMINELNNYYSTSISDLPPLYNYFDDFKAARFFFNGGRTHIANVKITTTQTLTGQNNIKKESGEHFQLFPNPARHFVNIQTDGKAEDLQLFDAMGRLVKQIKTTGENTRMDISQLQDGYYILRAGNNSKSFIKNTK